MPEIDFDRFKGTLNSLPQAVGRLMDEMAEPREASRAAKERSEAGEMAKASHVQAELAITVAADHMFALERELTEPVMTFAPWTTARGILEAASAAMWLLEDVDLQTRLARSMSMRFLHLEDEETYVRDAHKRDPKMSSFVEALPHIKARVEHLRREAAQLKIPEKKDRHDRLLGFGEGMPNATDLTDCYLTEGGTFRLLSASSHGRTWANLALSLRRVRLQGKLAFQQHLAMDSARFLIISALDWFARPVWAYFRLNGWDLQQLSSILEAKYDEAALVEDQRFWRLESRGPQNL